MLDLGGYRGRQAILTTIRDINLSLMLAATREISNLSSFFALHRNHGDAKGYAVPLGGHVLGAAIHVKRDWSRDRQQPGRAWARGVSRCKYTADCLDAPFEDGVG